jgi:hypothetical protein
VALLAAACGSREEPPGQPALPNPALGKWESKDGGPSMEFRSDGTMTFHTPKGDKELRYKVLDDHRLELTMGGKEGRSIHVTVDGDKLTAKGPPGELMLQRVKESPAKTPASTPLKEADKIEKK